jgi:hypothetical protein
MARSASARPAGAVTTASAKTPRRRLDGPALRLLLVDVLHRAEPPARPAPRQPRRAAAPVHPSLRQAAAPVRHAPL